jgi:hypothetical protein
MLSSAVGIGVISIVATRWIYRRIRNDEIYKNFVWDMAENHLPHIYHELRRQSRALNLDDLQPPPVRFVDLNGHR